MMSEENNTKQLLADLYIKIFDSSIPTIENNWLYCSVADTTIPDSEKAKEEPEALKTGKKLTQYVVFNNKTIELEQSTKKIAEIEDIMQRIFYQDEDKLIKIEYVKQNDKSIIKQASYYNEEGNTLYQISFIPENEVYDFILKDLQQINEIKEENQRTDFENKIQQVFKTVHKDNKFNFVTQKNGEIINIDNAETYTLNGSKVSIDSIQSQFDNFFKGAEEQITNNKTIFSKMKDLKNLARCIKDWKNGYFGVRTDNEYFSIVLNYYNPIETNILAKQTLKNLRLINWEHNKIYNEQYLIDNLKTESSTQKVIKDLNLNSNTYIPLCYSKHLSLLFTDQYNQLCQYNTGITRVGLDVITNQCKNKQKGEWCGYNINNYILSKYKNEPIENLQDTQLSDFETFGVTETLNVQDDAISILENITQGIKLENKQLYYETVNKLFYLKNIKSPITMDKTCNNDGLKQYFCKKQKEEHAQNGTGRFQMEEFNFKTCFNYFQSDLDSIASIKTFKNYKSLIEQSENTILTGNLCYSSNIIQNNSPINEQEFQQAPQPQQSTIFSSLSPIKPEQENQDIKKSEIKEQEPQLSSENKSSIPEQQAQQEEYQPVIPLSKSESLSCFSQAVVIQENNNVNIAVRSRSALTTTKEKQLSQQLQPQKKLWQNRHPSKLQQNEQEQSQQQSQSPSK